MISFVSARVLPHVPVPVRSFAEAALATKIVQAANAIFTSYGVPLLRSCHGLLQRSLPFLVTVGVGAALISALFHLRVWVRPSAPVSSNEVPLHRQKQKSDEMPANLSWLESKPPVHMEASCDSSGFHVVLSRDKPFVLAYELFGKTYRQQSLKQNGSIHTVEILASVEPKTALEVSMTFYWPERNNYSKEYKLKVSS